MSYGSDIPVGMSPHRPLRVRNRLQIPLAIEAALGRQGIAWAPTASQMQVERGGHWFVIQPIQLRDGTPVTYYFSEAGPYRMPFGDAAAGVDVNWVIAGVGILALGAVLLVDRPQRGWP